jgi:hypothetical protein
VNAWPTKRREVFEYFYPRLGSRECARIMGISQTAVKSYAKRHGNKVRRSAMPTIWRAARRLDHSAPVWQDDEDDLLRSHYPSQGAEILALRMDRTHGAIRKRAEDLGVYLTPETLCRINCAARQLKRRCETWRQGVASRDWIPSLGEIKQRAEAIRLARKGSKP